MRVNRLRKLLVTLLKFGISAAILYYLIRQAQRHQSFASLRDQPKDWGLLALAWLLALVAVSITFLRWFTLVRALELPFKIKDAFRLGFLGYLFNFVSVGSVGGDLFKAVCIAREQHGRRVEAVASVVIDRVVGMYSLLLVATVGILASGLYRAADSPQMILICRATLAAAAIGTLGVAILLIPAISSPYSAHLVSRVPGIGGALHRVLGAIRMYRDKLGVLLLACIMGLTSHAMFTITVYLIACGLPGEHPSLLQHFVIVPLGMAAGALPLPLGALGAFEYVLDTLYRTISGSEQGLVVALGYRLITVAIAMVGGVYYASSRREVTAALHEAEALEENPELDDADSEARASGNVVSRNAV